MTQILTPEDRLADLNQPPLWSGINAYRSDPLLADLTASMPRSLREDFEATGRYVTSFEAQELARMANENPPKLRTHGPAGERLDALDCHPAWHALMRRSMSSGLHCSVWENSGDEAGFSHKARAVRYFLTSQLECGHLTALSTTSAAVAAILTSTPLQREWGPKILSRKYDSGSKPPAAKNGLTIGVAVAEKRGGSDFGAIRSTAEKVSDAVYRLAGHKWFVSAPMSDAFVMLAQTREGLGCFLVPRILPDGGSNGLHIQRLKETIGHRSNATAEIEFGKTLGYLLGGPDAGSRTMLDMVTLMRLDSALSSCGLMRASVAEAVHFCRNRTVFSKPLIDQPIMTRVLADMALDVAAATALSFRLADAFDRARLSSDDAAYARIMTPVSKYWTCKIAPALIAETIECLGGSGYVEDRPLARHYREAPMNAVWEGPGNMMALDLLRVLNRGRDLFESVLAGIAADLGSGAQKTIDVLRAAMALCQRDEGAARLLIEQLALAAGAAELKRLGAGRIADAFLETRLAGGWRSTYGMLDSRFDAAYIVDLLYPSPV
ncbi:MAG: hypothetical protein RIR97_1055 [Pseudomonadota bacterium]